MNTSGIEWTDRTWNPVSGCSHVSAGCKNCYAERLFPRPYPGRKFTDVRCHPERLDQPLKIKKPQRIFVNSMSDLFHEDVPDAFIAQVFNVMFEAAHHTFQVLTKRPERMRDFFIGSSGCGAGQEPISNVWLGVSIEDQKTADERIPLLLATPAAVRFVSCEPLLGGIVLSPWLYGREGNGVALGRPVGTCVEWQPGLDWLIIGGESGPKARPMDPDWARSIRDQCVAADVPFFFKQWGEFVQTVNGDFATVGRGCKEWKKTHNHLLDGKAWQEFPGTAHG